MGLVYKLIKYLLLPIFLTIILFTLLGSVNRMTVNHYLQKSDFNKIKEIFSNKWNDFHYCKYSNGEKIINNITFDKNNENTSPEFTKAGKTLNIALSESYFEKVFEISGANCFFGENEYFLIQTDNGSMDYYIGYAYFHNSKSISENTEKLYKSKIYLLRHGSKYKLTPLNGGWYIYEHIH